MDHRRRRSARPEPGAAASARAPLRRDEGDLAALARIQRKVLWLSTYMVHHANALRPNPDGTKIGGHQASSSSVVSLMTALYGKALRPDDLVAVKAHSSPVLYALEYLRGRLTAEALRGLRSFGGLQAYPSRRKNPEIVDLSTGSMGLGAVAATFGALAGRYLHDHFGAEAPGRVIAIVGDAELDEGNVWEALLEEAVSRLDNLLWIVDLNRQSLDRITPDGRPRQYRQMFGACGWRVIELRWGERLAALFSRPGGDRLRVRLEGMPHAEYQALLRLPAGAARKALVTGPGGTAQRTLERLLARVGDEELHSLLSDLGGHDLGAILEALAEAEGHRGGPCVILAHTIKGWGLPLAGDPMNHGALLTPSQLEELQRRLEVAPGEEWAGFPPDSPEAAMLQRALPAATRASRPAPEVPDGLDESYPRETSTQEALGRILGKLGRLPIGSHIVTLSADVAVTTHLAGWINRKGVYFPGHKPNYFAEIPQAVQWQESPAGQHIELGIAEHNLFLALGALGLARHFSGVPLVPMGTLYDPFVARGLDALYHALYSGARFIVLATPSGVSLSPEGGAHQSVVTPGVGVALPGLVYFEPAFAREVEWIILEAIRGLLTGEEGESYYLRLSTKPVDQALAPPPGPEHRAEVLHGGYRLVDARSEPGYDPDGGAVHLFAAGVMVPEALEASRALRAQGILASVFAVTSPDLLYRGLRAPRPHLERLVTAEEEGVPVVSVIDGHSHALAFIGAALGVPQIPLGVDHFGQSGARRDLYRHYGIDAEGIAGAARLLLAR